MSFHKLPSLQPLQKKHFHWPFEPEWSENNTVILKEFARIMGTICFNGRWDTEASLRSLVSNRDNNTLFGLNYSPWHYKWDKTNSPEVWDQSAIEETDLLRERFKFIQDNVPRIDYVLYNCRVFSHVPSTKSAIKTKQEIVYGIAKQFFPSAKVIWYSQGQRNLTKDGWRVDRTVAPDISSDAFTVTLQQLPELHLCRHVFTKALETSLMVGKDSVIPWISLGAAIRYIGHKPLWSDEVDYPLDYSYALGQEINRPLYGTIEHEAEYAPWRYCKEAIFYPVHSDKFPHWLKHFIAYVEGANNRQNPIGASVPS